MAYPVTAKRIEVQAPLIISKKWLLFWRSILEASNSIIHYYSVQRLPIADCMMISATAPMFTTFYARFFLKENTVPGDIVNLGLVFVGILFIVKPPFIFGYTAMYFEDPEAIYAIIALITSSVFLQANVYIILRIESSVSDKYS